MHRPSCFVAAEAIQPTGRELSTDWAVRAITGEAAVAAAAGGLVQRSVSKSYIGVACDDLLRILVSY